MILLDLFGDPIPLARPKFFRTKSHVGCYDSQKKLKEGIQWQIRSQFRGEPITAPLSLDLCFFMPIPKSTSKTTQRQMENGLIAHMKKPDIDNLQKFVLDCLNGVVLKDDAQVVEIRAKKIYAAKPGTLIRLQVLADTDTSLLYENCTRTHGRRDISRSSI